MDIVFTSIMSIVMLNTMRIIHFILDILSMLPILIRRAILSCVIMCYVGY